MSEFNGIEAEPGTGAEPAIDASGDIGTPVAGEPMTDGGVVETFDYSGDGVPDFVIERLADGSLVGVSDENGDLLADTMGVDLDGDGSLELTVTRTADGYHVSVDQDGDGVFEVETDMTREQLLELDPGVVEALDLQFGTDPVQVAPEPDTSLDPLPESEFVVDGELVGDPTGDAEHWFEQAVNGFCVPASIAQIVSEYTGEHHADEQHFVERANELKVFEVGMDGVPGVGVDGALALLEDAGIPASIEFGTGVETLVEYLDEGRRVLLAVDSGEIWTGEGTEDNAPDHAIVVTGVDVERGVVIVSDPGDPEGNQKEYPVEIFEDAWADSGYAAVVCDVTPAEFAASTTGTEGTPSPQVAGTPAGVVDITGAADSDALDVGGAVAEEDRSPIEAAVDWTVQNPWVVLPLLLGARAVAGIRK